MSLLNSDEVGTLIMDSAIAVHREIGPGLLESSYSACLAYELRSAGLKVLVEHPLPLVYRGVTIDCGYRIDLLVEDLVIIELKAVKALNDVHFAQLLGYLRLSNLTLGYLMNFNVRLLKHGVRRVVNDPEYYR